jgi:two-component system, chemotaxis family, CheB/CheR fusion protein
MAGDDPHQLETSRARSGRLSQPARAPPESAGSFLVVGIGASAGGLDACRKLLGALPASSGMAFILVQHLDPNHESMMVDLLAGHTTMAVRQATDGMPLEADHFYVIPPGSYLSVGHGALHLSQPQARHGARLPFDFLLHSLAEQYGPRAVCLILSGTGADGSLGLKSVKEQFGFVVAQAPDEAAFDGMPRSAIITGAVDVVLPVAEIPGALAKYSRGMALNRSRRGHSPPGQAPEQAPDRLPAIIDLLRLRTGHDFTLYKPGTLRRRIERRMAIAAIATGDTGRYLDILRNDGGEFEMLAKDLFIHVTSFFRDHAVFNLLADKIVPELVGGRTPDNPLRIWVAGCSTGEETYSLAMLFSEQIALAGGDIKLQIFASDVDPDAVASAREGLYPEAIEADVSPARIARFFTREERGYRVSPALRASVVFTVQDVLADPPFFRLDLISCRNLLIYLRPEAQAKVISLFHFALQPGGILLLGSSETIGHVDGRFEPIFQSERLYRRIGRGRAGALGVSSGALDGVRVPARPAQSHAQSRHADLAELCRRMVIEAYAPAAVLINRKHECLFSVGPTERYLRVATGHPTHDLLSMVREDTRIRLRSAIEQASQQDTRVIVTGARRDHDGRTLAFNIEARPVPGDADDLLLICFVDQPEPEQKQARPDVPAERLLVEDLERELAATRGELQAAIRNLEISNEEQRTINEEALSVNEEYQSTNEELVTSREELQSLNEELTALNGQLQETLERQRSTANDLQNVLYSTDVATIFLDKGLYIRFFTPATRSLFNVLPSDIGRPLADLHSLSTDAALLSDAATVLQTQAPIEREIAAQNGTWFSRRIMPYRTQDAGVEGVVITFADVTARRHAADALAAAKRQADLASAGKSRFLAAASHDLRQPLQALVLLQGALTQCVESAKARALLAQLDETLSAMTGMLDSLLDINQIETGTLLADVVTFPINDLLDRMRSEFTDPVQAHGLALRVVPCGLSVRSDPQLLEQMIRNLLANALKYTERGKLLLGCRRHAGTLSIEVWDSGIGIPASELQAIFEEYHQLDNPARERSRGLGLGLTIVQRLGHLLGHRVRVDSRLGKGSIFAIEVALSPSTPPIVNHPRGQDDAIVEGGRRTGAVLVVEDDPGVSKLLEFHLSNEGHRTMTAPDGVTALDLVARGAFRPDLVLADHNLPNGLSGLGLAAKLLEVLERPIPVIILTGDISTGTLRDIALQNCLHLSKPVRPQELAQAIQRLLAAAPASVRPPVSEPVTAAPGLSSPVIFVVDDDRQVRDGLRSVLDADGRTVEDFPTSEAFLDAYRPGREACLLIDAYLPGMSGFELLQRLHARGYRLPAIMITGHSDVAMVVRAMKAGATDFIEKPIGREALLASVERALAQSRDATELTAWRETAARHVAALTAREHQIMDLVLAGHPSKNIAADLAISQRTVENHRATIMKKTGVKSLPALARLALAAAWTATNAGSA